MTAVLGPRTKGLQLTRSYDADSLPLPAPLTSDLFTWPILTADDGALRHNIEVMARVCAAHGVQHAPHVKTPMAQGLYFRQADAGAWGATVATGTQLRTVWEWGVKRIFLANEQLDPRELRWLADRLTGDREVWLYIDSGRGIERLHDAGLSGAPGLGVLVELGVPGGRTGVRDCGEVLRLGRTARDAGLPVIGIAGYEGPAASGDDPRATVRSWLRELARAGEAMTAAGLFAGRRPVISAGGSAYLDVVLDVLSGLDAQVVVRSGAYLTHDDGLYAGVDPWQRITGAEPLRAALRLWTQVLSVPEYGLAICGAGRRDVSFDHGLPVPLLVRSQAPDGTLGPGRSISGETVKLDDQHLYLRTTTAIEPGDVLAFGISHPCTTFDKWQAIAITDADEMVTQVLTTDF